MTGGQLVLALLGLAIANCFFEHAVERTYFQGVALFIVWVMPMVMRLIEAHAK